MKGSPVPRLSPMVFFLAAFVLVATPAPADPGKPREGRFLYAGDDDWDWASPLGTATPTKLSRYGAMPWSALDWAEEGLKDVKGVLLGTPPKSDLAMEEISRLRENATYTHHLHEPGAIEKLLADPTPPDVLILMENTAKGVRVAPDDIERLTNFVKNGGRLLVLDDWARYPPVMEAVLEAALARPGEKLPPADPTKKKANPDPDLEVDKEFVEQIRGLVGDLGAANFRTRENAMHALRKLGLPAVKLADELRPDDPEIAARLARLGAELKPKGAFAAGVVTNEARRKKHLAAAERVRDGAARLELAGFPHEVDTVYVDKENAPLSILKLAFPDK